MTATLEQPAVEEECDPRHVNFSTPPDDWYDWVVVMFALRGRWDLVKRPLSLAERLVVLGAAMDAYDESVRQGRRENDHPNTLDSLARRFGWRSATMRAMRELARPGRVPPQRGTTWTRMVRNERPRKRAA